MSKNFSRAGRRHHTARLKRRTFNIITKQWYTHSDEWAKWAVVRRWDNMKNCSCASCGNQRKYYGHTIQEIRHINRLDAELVDYFNELGDTLNDDLGCCSPISA